MCNLLLILFSFMKEEQDPGMVPPHNDFDG